MTEPDQKVNSLDQAAVHKALLALKERDADCHKGDFGTVVVVGGCEEMIGAPALTATAAFRAGAGLVKMALPESIVSFALGMQPSATAISLNCESGTVDQDLFKIVGQIRKGSVLAIGPGWGATQNSAYKKQLLLGLIESNLPMVIDADGLNLLAEIRQPIARIRSNAEENSEWQPIILTPHPGEMARLLAAAHLPEAGESDAARQLAARRLSEYHRATVLLKGNRTVIASGELAYFNETGDPVMATAGSGDVLTGVIAALLAGGKNIQTNEQAFVTCCAIGAYWHGLAGQYWAGSGGKQRSLGMLAGELADALPEVLADLPE